ncbi:hypothetical protein GGD55_003071 [Rhizobium giardinii]|uniref:Uncharacterized protein n=1 Tax=Rhizobium giardinii TaxID=56731 RepID=A0A7W8UCU6_9HYPH|nr:hypothetical protein [Rhizobium giardinii]
MSDERTNPPPAVPVKWGTFGKERGHGITEWRCAEHRAPDYWDGRPTRETERSKEQVRPSSRFRATGGHRDGVARTGAQTASRQVHVRMTHA